MTHHSKDNSNSRHQWKLLQNCYDEYQATNHELSPVLHLVRPQPAEASAIPYQLSDRAMNVELVSIQPFDTDGHGAGKAARALGIVGESLPWGRSDSMTMGSGGYQVGEDE